MGNREIIEKLLSGIKLTHSDMHNYQHKGVDFLLDNPKSALFIDLGLGKTIISLTALVHLIVNGDIKHALIIAPKRVANDTWPNEIGNWQHISALTYRHVKNDEVDDYVKREVSLKNKSLVLQHGVEYKNTEEFKHEIDKTRVKAMRTILKKQHTESPRPINIVSRDNVLAIVRAWASKWPYDCIIIDESDSLKDHKTRRYRALKSVLPHVTRMHQLTATPASETYLHLFAQMYLLDGGERLGTSMEMYKSDYFIENRFSREIKIRDGAEDRIAEKISDITLTMKAEDYLPPMTVERIYDYIELPQKAESLYKKMERDFVVNIDEATIEADTAAALSQKLLQIASGVLYEQIETVEGDKLIKSRRVHHVHDEKIDTLKVLMEECQGENVLVSYWHNASKDRLLKVFPYAVAMDDKGDCIKKWNNGKIRMLLVHPDSAAHGLNLQHGGRRLVVFDMFWSNGKYQQLVGRLARQGQKKVVFVHHFIAKNTIEEIVKDVVLCKQGAQELLFKLLKKLKSK